MNIGATQEELALLGACSFCGAARGEWCQTRAGVVAQWLHSARMRPVREAWSSGYQFGRETAFVASRERLALLAQQARLAHANRPVANVAWEQGYLDLIALIEQEATR